MDYRSFVIIKDHLKCRHISAGDYSYYAGFGRPFEESVLYLDEKDNERDDIDRLIIGKFCSIAYGAKFMMGGNQGHVHQWIATYPLEDLEGFKTSNTSYKRKGDTVIGNDVWIGAEALLMPGVQIGDGAVIAARAVVTKNVGPYEIWGGNPARLIKKRFSDEEIKKLLALKWWDWDLEKLKENLHLLQSSDISAL